MKKFINKYAYVFCFTLALTLFAQTSKADEFFEWKSDEAGTIWVTANLSISGNTLTIDLANISTTDSLDQPDVLGSFYFDIFKEVEGEILRPVLNTEVENYFTATGELYNTYIGLSDDTAVGDAGEDNIDPWWDVRDDMDPELSPSVGAFGVGTTGNNLLTPNNFPGLDGLAAGIYKGEVTTEALTTSPTQPLVKELATFTLTFEDLSGFSIGPLVAFGFGTGPDNFHVVPVPGAVLLGILGLGVAGIKLRKHT